MENTFVVEHSNEQNCFNIEEINQVLKINLNNLLEHGNSDYQILFIGTYDECEKFIEDIKEKII